VKCTPFVSNGVAKASLLLKEWKKHAQSPFSMGFLNFIHHHCLRSSLFIIRGNSCTRVAGNRNSRDVWSVEMVGLGGVFVPAAANPGTSL
jgi:hypothetical protein